MIEHFQPVGYDCVPLFVGLMTAALIVFMGVICCFFGNPSFKYGDFPKIKLRYLPVFFIPLLFFGVWHYLSLRDIESVAKVDELYYFKVQKIEGLEGKPKYIYLDNFNRVFDVKPVEDKLVRKRVFRGTSWLISWEWREIDFVPIQE